MGPLMDKPKVIELEKSDVLPSGYVGVTGYVGEASRKRVFKRRFSVAGKGQWSVPGRFATVQEAALRRHLREAWGNRQQRR